MHRCGLVFLMVVASACGRSSQSNLLNPGDSDYPVQNSRRSHLVQVIAVIPATLSVRFSAGYGTSSADGRCQRTVGLGVTAPLSVDVSIRLVQGEGVHRGIVALDQFDRGPCDWRFVALGFHTVNPSSEAVLVGVPADHRQGLKDYKLHVWCVHIPKQNPQRPEFCAGLDFLKRIGAPVSSDFISSLAADERNNAGPVPIGSQTQSITIEFHDLDATAPSIWRR